MALRKKKELKEEALNRANNPALTLDCPECDGDLLKYIIREKDILYRCGNVRCLHEKVVPNK